MFHHKEKMPTPEQALPGRNEPVLKGRPPHVLFGEQSRYVPPFPEGMKVACFGNGCFWGPEMRFWEMPGVYSTAVGYCGGLTPNPTCVPIRAVVGHNGRWPVDSALPGLVPIVPLCTDTKRCARG